SHGKTVVPLYGLVTFRGGGKNPDGKPTAAYRPPASLTRKSRRAIHRQAETPPGGQNVAVAVTVVEDHVDRPLTRKPGEPAPVNGRRDSVGRSPRAAHPARDQLDDPRAPEDHRKAGRDLVRGRP